MARSGPTAGIQILVGASVLAAVLGSVHAFSVFLVPFEVRFNVSRADVSLTYSLALVSLTIAVLLGHHLFDRWSAPTFVCLVAVFAAAGAAIAAIAPTLGLVWIGYGLLFGAANGLGYGFALQIAAQSNPAREGAAMGAVTAAYALGAAVAPPVFSMALDEGGIEAAMICLAIALVVAAIISATMLALAGAVFHRPTPHQAFSPPRSLMALLWIGYGTGVAGGLMVIGHAAGIVQAFEGNDDSATRPWIAPFVVAICNLTGSLAAGRLADRMSPIVLLIALPIFSAISLLFLSLSGGLVALACLGAIGFTYGGVIAVYPSAISKEFGVLNGPRIYGMVFTAWGTSGLLGPWIAGQLYDGTGAYGAALLAASALGAVSSIAAVLFYARSDNEVGAARY